MKIEYMMPEYELMSKDQIVNVQFRKFKEEIQKAWECSPFYRRKFSEQGFEPTDIKTPDDIVRVPKTSKEEIVKDIEEHPPYGSRSSCSTSEMVCVAETSGTTGKGKEVHILGVEELHNTILAEEYGFFFAGVRKGTVTMLTMPVTMASAGYWWTLALYELGANYFRIGDASSEEKLNYMRRYGVEILYAGPSFLKRLEHTAAKMGIDTKKDIPSLKGIIVATEAWTPEWAIEVQERWDAKLYEQWGCTQRGYAWSCEFGAVPAGKRGILHFLPHLELCEVINRDTGKHAQPGEEGEIVVTPFGAGKFPLIRFSTNDKAKYLDTGYCSCGRPFDGIEAGTISRYDDMMKVKGVNFWPAAVDEVVFRYKKASEYRGIVYISEDGREEIAVEIEFHEGTTDADKKTVMNMIAEELRKKIGIGFRVKESIGQSLSMSVYQQKTGKTKRWTDKRLQER